MDDSTSHEARADAFPLARKGYDRRQVDAYREENEARIDALERQIQSLEGNLSELGLSRPVDLATELDVVGEEVKRVLQEARVAAEQMRSRASDDAARWRAEADEESRALRESSRTDAYEIRRSVWEVGSEMLAAAVAESDAVAIAATERALFTQADAERDSSRLVGEARRERDESVGGAREEAELLISAARQESESIMTTARRQAEAAQERARALEMRRAELMAELEAARATIAGTETESEAPEGSDAPTAEPAAPAAVVEETEDARTHWPEDEGSVKIVSATRAMSAERVDADEMVAEIEAMRREPESRQLPVTSPQPEPSPESPVVSLQPEPESDQLPAASPEPEREPELARESESSSSPSGGGVAAGDGGGQEAEPDTKPGPEPSSVPSAEGRGDAEERSDEAGGSESDQPPATSLQPEPEPTPDPLAGLFARLRDPAADGDAGGQGSDQLPASSSQPEPEPDPEPESSSSPSGGGADEGGGGGQEGDRLSEASSGPDPQPEPEPETEPSLDPFALRERHLLPIQNRALRGVKRNLVEAQNRALEDLRLVDGWEPDGNIVSGEISEALAILGRESLVAGFAAAAEMMETTETPQPEDVASVDPSPEFTAALVEAAQNSVVRSRGTGAGHRETASSLSRVFRSWRTDEAERRVQFASRTAYHIGVAAALADLGVTDLAVSSSGRPCPECPANKGSWAIVDGLPSGTSMPPVRLECACTIVSSP